MTELVSEEYRAQLLEMHNRPGPPWGNKGYHHAGEALNFLGDGHSILDYGSGKGTFGLAVREIRPDLDVRDYDPGVPGATALPDPADLVVCTDVLEHIEPDRLAAVLAHLFGLARRRAYLDIALFEAKKTLPDGRNAHLIIRPAPWWLDVLASPDWWFVRTDIGLKKLTLWMERV